MKVNINKLPAVFSIRDGKVYQDGGTTGNQSDYGLVTYPQLDPFATGDAMSKVNYSINAVPRDEANLEAEKGETVLTDLNDDGNFELYEIQGKRHHQGGTPLHLPPQSFIYSDTPAMKFSKYELAEMGLESKKRLTPAAVSKKYQLNNFMGLLDDESSDYITRDTAEYMIGKNKRALSQLAFLQEAKKEFDSYDSTGINLTYSHFLPIGTLKLSSTYLKNAYDEPETFLSVSKIRDDESFVNSISLEGQIIQLLPFIKNSKISEGVFYTLKLRQSDVSSNIQNHDVERKFFTMGLTKRFNLNELFK